MELGQTEQNAKAINFGHSADDKLGGWMLGLFALLGIVYVAYLIMIITYYVLECKGRKEEVRAKEASHDKIFAAQAADILRQSNTMVMKPLCDKTETEPTSIQVSNNETV